MKPLVSIAALACGIVATLESLPAQAQTVLPPPPPAVMVERPVLPNPVLMQAGLTVLAVSYIPAAGVALFSDHEGDAYLFIPVAGPWIDLATRGCDGSTMATVYGPVEVSSGNRCGTSGSEEAALIVDGIAQGVGALTFLASLMVPERRLTPWARGSKAPPVAFSPTSFGGRGIGAAAAGRF